MFNTIILYFLSLLGLQLFFIQDGIIVHECLLVILFISMINALREMNNHTNVNAINLLNKQINTQKNHLSTLQIELVKETIKKLYFSMLYAAQIKNQELFDKSKNSLSNIGLDETILKNPNNLLTFIEDITTNKIKIEYNSKDKKYIFKKK